MLRFRRSERGLPCAYCYSGEVAEIHRLRKRVLRLARVLTLEKPATGKLHEFG